MRKHRINLSKDLTHYEIKHHIYGTLWVFGDQSTEIAHLRNGELTLAKMQEIYPSDAKIIGGWAYYKGREWVWNKELEEMEII